MKTVIPSISLETLIWHANRDAPGAYKSPFLCGGIAAKNTYGRGQRGRGSEREREPST